MAQVVAPKTRLRAEYFVSDVQRLLVVEAALFAVDKRREPEILSDIGPPAIEIEIVAGQRRPAIRAVEADDVKILILHPDAPYEASLVALLRGVDIKDQAADFAQEFAAHVLDVVVRLVEAVGVQKNHLQEAAREKLRSEELRPASEHL